MPLVNLRRVPLASGAVTGDARDCCAAVTRGEPRGVQPLLFRRTSTVSIGWVGACAPQGFRA